jgi:hypothetical protein
MFQLTIAFEQTTTMEIEDMDISLEPEHTFLFATFAEAYAKAMQQLPIYNKKLHNVAPEDLPENLLAEFYTSCEEAAGVLSKTGTVEIWGVTEEMDDEYMLTFGLFATVTRQN